MIKNGLINKHLIFGEINKILIDINKLFSRDINVINSTIKIQ